MLQLFTTTLLALVISSLSNLVWASESTGENMGEELYFEHCAACHQVDGSGWGFEIPSLALSQRLRGKKLTLIEFVLHGSDLRQGFITESNIPMPAFEALSDDEMAALLTYVRDTLGDHASAVTANEVADGRLVLGELMQNRKKD